MNPVTLYAGHSLAVPLTLCLAALAALFIPIITGKDNAAPGAAVLGAALVLLCSFPVSGTAVLSLFGGSLVISPFTNYVWIFFLAALVFTALISLTARDGKPGAGEYYFLLTWPSWASC